MVLQEGGAGFKVEDLCRRHGIRCDTYYAWKKRYGGMSISEARRLKQLEEENAQHERIASDQMLDVMV